MAELLHELIHDAAKRAPTVPAVSYRGEVLDYCALLHRVEAMADAYAAVGLKRGERVGIYLEKRFETVVAMFGAAAAGIVFVPINPILKPRQVGYIMRDCNVRLLVTSGARLSDLADEIGNCPDLSGVVLVDDGSPHIKTVGPEVVSWQEFHSARTRRARSRIIDVDMAAILYTSGSTGNPKGVVLSHRNMVAGAKSVSRYLENSPDDRILSVLPLSFDAGLSQLTTAFSACAKVVLLNYLLPRDVVRACADEAITGLTGVPPLWVQLADLEWPDRARGAMRYFANTGGHMPFATLQKLRAALPEAKPFLMYGLTE